MKLTALAIPASYTAEEAHLREKTFKIGLVGRAAAIFRMNEILIYLDKPEYASEGELAADILRYMETPQYLRKRLFPLRPRLKYVGILPPLRTPHHPLQGERISEGSFREGVVVKTDRARSWIDIGLPKPAVSRVPLEAGKRVTVKIVRAGRIPEVVPARLADLREYWGYKVTFIKRELGRCIQMSRADLVIATSRYGTLVTEVLDELAKRWRQAGKTLILFGSPFEGLEEILEREGLELEDVADFTINTVPMQAVKTVRTEEAIFATLAILNAFVFARG